MNTIRIHRRKKCLPATRLAETLEVSRQTVYKWESGLSIPDWPTMQALSHLLDAPVDSLFDRDEIGWARVNERRRIKAEEDVL